MTAQHALKQLKAVADASKDVLLAAGYPEWTTEDFWETFKEGLNAVPAKSSEELLAIFSDLGLSSYLLCFARLMTRYATNWQHSARQRSALHIVMQSILCQSFFSIPPYPDTPPQHSRIMVPCNLTPRFHVTLCPMSAPTPSTLSTPLCPVSAAVLTNADAYTPFIEAMFPGYDAKAFCSREVEPTQKEADHMHIAALTAGLGVPTVIEYLDGSGT